MKFNDIDSQILEHMQRDCTLPIGTLATKVGLSKTACWNRIQKLMRQSVIIKRTIEIDERKLGFEIHALMLVKTDKHEEAWIRAFHAHIQSIPQIISFRRLTGEVDYILEVIAKDMADYNRIYDDLVRGCSLASISTHIVMQNERKALPTQFIN